ncbi:MAG: glycosyltransferase, partial [Phycisphaeraceae bacterium]
SLVEAALSGCELILADIPRMSEVWGDAACYVDANDARALRRAIRRYIDEPALMRRMARRARRRARRYTTEAMAQRYMELYETIHRRGGRMEGAYSCES